MLRVQSSDPRSLQDFLAKRLSLSRRAAKEILDQRRVWVNRSCVWMARAALRVGDVVELSKALTKAPVKFHARILWQDNDYLVCDKMAGRLSCGDDESVESFLRAQENCSSLAAVHRLDRDTTGCLLFAKNARAKNAAIDVFKTHRVLKVYHAIVAGCFPVAHQRIDAPLDGEAARSVITREAMGAEATLLRIRLETGRTNQIRRHLAKIRFPVVGDRVFGLKNARDARLLHVPRQMLHASTLEMPHPLLKGETLRVHAPLPSDFRSALSLFGMGRRAR